ncbi:hypothetical protein POREN0001_0572 [Porphyromonas endodontalis ATCC 35406]|uniref:Uncharacterized protein n=1 Tax=Porphyromonas endodontalis (strain ATCC 35406 / DSM 24491 / JCM 8526 / CCUG 16442 / BCRC 14492 / NCTC 13058 / HG 370) TaxID=553175 RepID=C3J8Q3_POREA|nr:hypothetical protein POREN0001_0572 [Porphyromonas endodontalis ATCC 35406]
MSKEERGAKTKYTLLFFVSKGGEPSLQYIFLSLRTQIS